MEGEFMHSKLSVRVLLVGLLAAIPFMSGNAQQLAASDAKGTHLASGHGTEVTVRDGSLARAAVAHSSQYTIGVADVLRINVWKNADLSQNVIVDPDGFISLPLLGNVNVAGMSTNQLGTLLTEKYASYVVTPQVTVSLVDIRSRAVFVMGQVGKAGSYPLLAPITVLQLIAQAGGLTPFAKRKSIYVLRASMGHSEKIPFNYVKVIHGDTRGNIELQAGDTVIVP
jgi:polysaccharide export outer membrane protein